MYVRACTMYIYYAIGPTTTTTTTAVEVESAHLLFHPLFPNQPTNQPNKQTNNHTHSSETAAAAFLSPPGRPPVPPGSLAALPPCLSPWDSAQVQAEAKGSVERAREELRRYRVRHEMLLRGKEAEIKQVRSTSGLSVCGFVGGWVGRCSSGGRRRRSSR